MTEIELRAKIHALMAAGTLPTEPPVITRAGQSAHQLDACTICAEPDPTVSYFCPGGLVVRLHASCDAIWKRERDIAGGGIK